MVARWVTWTRDRASDAFLSRILQWGWDHAHAWIDSAVAVGSQVYLYYGGYRWGHKYNSDQDRQIGLVRMWQDRYVARQAGSEVGMLETPLLTLNADWMSLNVDASGGWIEVGVLDENGQAVSECDRVAGSNRVDQTLSCSTPLGELAGVPVRLAFKHAECLVVCVHGRGWARGGHGYAHPYAKSDDHGQRHPYGHGHPHAYQHGHAYGDRHGDIDARESQHWRLRVG